MYGILIFFWPISLGHFLSAALSYGTWPGIQSREPNLSQTLLFCNRDVNLSSVAPACTMHMPNKDLTGSVLANSTEIPISLLQTRNMFTEEARFFSQ
jgi:hypothetical protein